MTPRSIPGAEVTLGTDLRVAVAGASGALGGEILTVLDRAPWRPKTLVALARSTTSASHVDYGDDRVALDDAAGEALDDLDALFLALPPEPARQLGERALQEGTLTLDCSGAFAADADVPLIVPWINPEAIDEVRRGIVAIPSAAATLIASALGPLRRAGVGGHVECQVLVPASYQGKPGIDELSRQVIALFNSGVPPRKVFRQGLAFDLLPAIGEPDTTGVTPDEREVARQVARLAPGFESIDVALVGVPVFSGLSATVTVRPDRALAAELVERIIKDGGVQFSAEAGAGSRTFPRPRSVEGTPFASGARVRVGADGRSLHLWLAMDNLRAMATVAVGLAGALLRVRRD